MEENINNMSLLTDNNDDVLWCQKFFYNCVQHCCDDNSIYYYLCHNNKLIITNTIKILIQNSRRSNSRKGISTNAHLGKWDEIPLPQYRFANDKR